MPSMSMMAMDTFPEPKRSRNSGKVKAPLGQRRAGNRNEDYQYYGRRQGNSRGYEHWNRRPERRTDWQKGSDALQHYHEQGQQAFDAAMQMGHYIRGNAPTPAPQEAPPPPVRSPVQEQQMPMRLQCQWGFDGYMQPMQPQDTYMWTWPAMQPVQCQEWIWPVMPQAPPQPAPGPAVCTEAFVAAGHIVPELQGLTREQVAAVLKEAAQGLRYED
ncbi:unnamed protein product [Cladocopium goreaui]|uniref:Uncharacterized protein n=1 Tax=Cladocopium goreaui TaxID=2562237 RepID=A0A9P1BLU7_9DINO|nr:unnamed protein product [Cladocopium goreaui]|mmetsp:Transcript_29191/g.63448  ORF Transcript_29191/g.63448 Transcript_29191/m.63448 type:complete len:215 (-) Transcript_29191:162-806(-)